MKQLNRYFLVFYLFLLCEPVLSAVTNSNSFVVSTTESTKEESQIESDSSQVDPYIYSMQIHSNVSNRFATTLITSKVRNAKNKSEETTFAVILPENAFISEFEMEIQGKVYKAYVKEKEEAKEIYQQAVASGQSAAHVELSARDSKTFTVSINIEPESKSIFRLTYEELLQRQIGQYELVINIRPGQVVEDLGVQVHINENRPLTFVRTPSLRTGNEIGKNDEKLAPSAQIGIFNKTSATVKFNPDVNEQKEFAENLGGVKENGLAGQFVVQYDVERDPQGGEVLVRDGYFVHFFAPSELQSLPKHVVFVLDHSGSMRGRKFAQLVEAMQNILSELKSEDLFNLVRFADDASVWNEVENTFIPINITSPKYGNMEPHLRESNLPQEVKVTKENVDKAKSIIKDQDGMGATNIIAGLEVGLFLTKRTQEKLPNKYQPMILFLTDGSANVGLSSRDEITETATKVNSGTNRAAIFSLSFGYGADKDFLRKLSSSNLGFSRHIYEASDASLQLQDFYRTISSPLLSNITFSYVDGVSQVTKSHYAILFNGSEIVVAGRTGENPNVLLKVAGRCGTGPVTFNTTSTEPGTSLERLWAYLTVKQIINEKETETNTTELDKKALDLALKYSFVTSVSSLVVVKPNQTASVNNKVQGPEAGESRQFMMYGGGRNPPYFRRGRSRSRLISTTTVQSNRANTTLPQWLEDLKKNNGNITTRFGTFRLGKSGDGVSVSGSSKLDQIRDPVYRVTNPPIVCLKTPLNNTGVCTNIFDCPEIFSFLTDINIYLQYFCPLNGFAGACCPLKFGKPVV